MFGIFKKKPKAKPQKREDVVAEAMKNARAARAEIGEETLDKIADAIRKKNSPIWSAPRPE